MSAVRVLASLLDEGRGERVGHEELPTSTAHSMVNDCALVIRDQILEGEIARLPELLPDLLYATLVPYLGQEEALALTVAPVARI